MSGWADIGHQRTGKEPVSSADFMTAILNNGSITRFNDSYCNPQEWKEQSCSWEDSESADSCLGVDWMKKHGSQ